MAAKKSGKPVLVTTKHKGVFFGYVPKDTKSSNAPLKLTRARMCIRWSSAMLGVWGLASAGPDKECRIGPEVEVLTIHDVTAVADCTEQAAANWEKAPWQC